jgi:hypothetical protein
MIFNIPHLPTRTHLITIIPGMTIYGFVASRSSRWAGHSRTEQKWSNACLPFPVPMSPATKSSRRCE